MEHVVDTYLRRTGHERFCPAAVLFDMDGVLIDSMPNHAVAWQESMAAFGLHMTAADAYATEGARGIDTIRAMVLAQQGRTISLDEAQRMYDLKTECFGRRPKAPVMPGARQLLAQIVASGLQVCVVTGSGQRPLIARLTTDFAPYVDERHIITAYDVSRGKPAPDPYLMGMERCGTAPWQTVVVENAPLGVQAGVASGALTIAVNTGPLPDSQLLEAGAHLVLPGMEDLARRWNQLFSPTL